jgi:adenylate cyclase
VLDKFIGDALMAIWGAPIRRADDTERAVLCAIEMQERLSELNRERVAVGRDPIAIGIGINAGDAVVGNMGSSKRLEYTVIGDTVNLASRLCHLAGPGEILATQAVLARAGDRFQVQPLPPTPVRGKTQPVPTVRVLARK